MPNDKLSSRTPPHEKTPYKIDTAPLPLNLYSEYGGMNGCWYRVPSWRVHFDCVALKGVDVRMHRGVGSAAVWTLSEATTGFKMFGDLPQGAMLAEFAAGMMLKLTPEYVARAIAKASEILKGKPPSPFVDSERGFIDRNAIIEECVHAIGELPGGEPERDRALYGAMVALRALKVTQTPGELATAQADTLGSGVTGRKDGPSNLSATRLKGWAIRNTDGRWRTMDTIGMPDYTDDPAKALVCRLREHVERYAEDDLDDIRIIEVSW